MTTIHKSVTFRREENKNCMTSFMNVPYESFSFLRLKNSFLTKYYSLKQSKKSLGLLLIFDRNPPLIEMKSYDDSTTIISKWFHGTRRKSS